MYLEQYNHLAKCIDSRTEEIERLRSLTTKATASYSEMPSSSGVVKSQIEESLVRLEALIERLAQEIIGLVNYREEIDEVLNQLPPQYRDVLIWRYINRWNWQMIADALGVARSQTFRVHSAALHEVCKLLVNQ